MAAGTNIDKGKVEMTVTLLCYCASMCQRAAVGVFIGPCLQVLVSLCVWSLPDLLGMSCDSGCSWVAVPWVKGLHSVRQVQNSELATRVSWASDMWYPWRHSGMEG